MHKNIQKVQKKVAVEAHRLKKRLEIRRKYVEHTPRGVTLSANSTTHSDLRGDEATE